MSADEVVERSLRALGGKRVMCVPGFVNRLMYVVCRRFTAAAAVRLFRGKEKTNDSRVG